MKKVESTLAQKAEEFSVNLQEATGLIHRLQTKIEDLESQQSQQAEEYSSWKKQAQEMEFALLDYQKMEISFAECRKVRIRVDLSLISVDLRIPRMRIGRFERNCKCLVRRERRQDQSTVFSGARITVASFQVK